MFAIPGLHNTEASKATGPGGQSISKVILKVTGPRKNFWLQMLETNVQK